MENKLWDLPSAYNVGHEVCLQFGESNPIIRNCHVTKVIFTREKVMYDVQVGIYAPGGLNNEGSYPMCIGHTRIHSIDSAFVYPLNHNLWIPRTDFPDTPRKVNCRFTHEGQEFEFRAFVKWDGGGVEWFYEDGGAIRDALKFEWSEIK